MLTTAWQESGTYRHCISQWVSSAWIKVTNHWQKQKEKKKGINGPLHPPIDLPLTPAFAFFSLTTTDAQSPSSAQMKGLLKLRPSNAAWRNVMHKIYCCRNTSGHCFFLSYVILREAEWHCSAPSVLPPAPVPSCLHSCVSDHSLSQFSSIAASGWLLACVSSRVLSPCVHLCKSRQALSITENKLPTGVC